MKRIQRLLLSLISGVLLSLAWLGFPGWILFVAFLPLLCLDKFFIDRKNEYHGVSFWGHAMLAMLVWNILSTWWIMHATLVGAVMAILVNSFLMSLTLWLAHVARRKFKASLGYISFIVFWLSFEFFHFHWDIEWPWLQLGNGFANNVKMIQWYEVTGAFGGTLWVLIVNVLIFQLFNSLQKKDKRRILQVASVLSVFLVILPAVSFIRYYSYTEKANPEKVTVVQPNINPYSEKYNMRAETIKKDKFLRLAASVSDNETDFIVGPETFLENPSYWNEAMLNNNVFLHEMETFLHRYKKAEMVFGVSSFKIYTKESEVTRTARTRNGVTYDRFNTAIFIGRKLKPQLYHKSKLVVGVEKMPFMKYLGFIRDIVINIGGTT